MVAGMLKWIVIGVVVLGLLGALFGSGDDSEPTASKSTDSQTASSGQKPSPQSPSPEEAPTCERLTPARRNELAFGARRGVTVAKLAFVAPVESGADGYLAVALHVTRAGISTDVVLAAPAAGGKGLTLATEPALDYFTWGAMARNGSPVDEIRDAVEVSDAARTALACLASKG